jgi:hypothetical protein
LRRWNLPEDGKTLPSGCVSLSLYILLYIVLFNNT